MDRSVADLICRRTATIADRSSERWLLCVAVTLDNPGHDRHFTRAPHDDLISRYTHHSSNNARWQINLSSVTPLLLRGTGSGRTILRLTLYDVSRSQAREIPLRFEELDGLVHVLYSAKTPPAWVSFATESAIVRWSIGYQQFIGTASTLEDPIELQTKILPRFRAKLGERRISRWFGSEVGCITLVESRDAAAYYHAVEALFDQSAPNYDRLVQGNRFDLHLRKVALEILRDIFPPESMVLELGCGTGLETIPLAEAGVEIVALDISAGMLGELDRKAREASVRNRIEIRKVPITDLVTIRSEFGVGSFDGAFSHFGAMNCEPQLGGIPPTLHQLVRPNGRISLGIWNRTCLSEMVLFCLGLRPARAMARFQSSVPVGRSRFGVPVFPYGPGEIMRLFGPFFALERAVGVSVFVPPYNLGRRLVPYAELVSLLETADRLVRNRPFIRFLGDHFLLQLRRR